MKILYIELYCNSILPTVRNNYLNKNILKSSGVNNSRHDGQIIMCMKDKLVFDVFHVYFLKECHKVYQSQNLYLYSSSLNHIEAYNFKLTQHEIIITYIFQTVGSPVWNINIVVKSVDCNSP